MSVKVRSFPVGGAVVVLTAGLVLTGCGNEAGTGAPETPSPATTPSEVDGGEQLVGRQCGESIVMAWSEDRSQIQGARELLNSAVEPVPVVGTTEWFVADITEAGEGGTGAPEHQAASKDLDRLATELGADDDEG